MRGVSAGKCLEQLRVSKKYELIVALLILCILCTLVSTHCTVSTESSVWASFWTWSYKLIYFKACIHWWKVDGSNSKTEWARIEWCGTSAAATADLQEGEEMTILLWSTERKKLVTYNLRTSLIYQWGIVRCYDLISNWYSLFKLSHVVRSSMGFTFWTPIRTDNRPHQGSTHGPWIPYGNKWASHSRGRAVHLVHPLPTYSNY